MANKEHLKVLRSGVEAWNEWRRLNGGIKPDLSSANLRKVNLRMADLSAANLFRTNLRAANLIDANLVETILLEANLGGADLRGADLRAADLRAADLSAANLDKADFSGADLYGANLNRAHPKHTNFSNAQVGHSMFTGIDLSTAIGLETVHHRYPSTLGVDTIYFSKGKIPEPFLRGAGVPDDFITYMGSLVGKVFDFYSCFISYSSKDQEFAERLYADLQSKGVRCWFAPEDLKIGDRFRVTIDETIRIYDKLLLVLSKHSVQSDWVEKEVETAMEREREEKHTILFPIRLDDAVIEIKTGWPADIRRSRHIGEFTKWKDHDAYQKAFDRLLRDLKAAEPKKK